MGFLKNGVSQAELNAVVLGQVPNNTITDLKLSDDPNGIKQRFLSAQAETATELELKRDKTTPIPLADLATDAREAMTGGSVAVIGTDMAGEENIKQGAMNYWKHFNYYPLLLKSKPKNLFNKNTATSGYIVNRLTGALVVSALYSASDYISVKPSTGYYKNNADVYSFYDVNKVFIIGSSGSGDEKKTVLTPENCTYVRICFPTTELPTLQLEEGISSTLYEPYVTDLLVDIAKYFTPASISTMLKDNKAVLDLFQAGLTSNNLFNIATITSGFYVSRTTGDLVANATYSSSDYILIKPSTNYIKNVTDQMAFYDANRVYISGLPSGTTTFTTPSNAVYIRVAGLTSVLGTLQVEEGSVSTAYMAYGLKLVTKSQLAPDVTFVQTIKSIMSQLVLSATTKKIKLIGDSRTHGVGGTGFSQDGELIMTVGSTTWNVNTSGHCWANSLKTYLGSKFNCTVTNYGCTGANSNSIVSGLNQLIDGDEDIVVCDIGTNDRHVTTKQQYYDNLKTIYNYCNNLGIKVIFMSSFPAGIDSETDVVNEYHMEDVDAVVFKVTNDLGLEYISMYKLFNEYCQNRGITIDSLLVDTLHPNDTGYDVLFYLICNALGIATRRSGAIWTN